MQKYNSIHINTIVSEQYLHCCYISAFVLTCFRLNEGSCYIFSTQNKCCKFLASCGVMIQSVTQSSLKTPVCGASLVQVMHVHINMYTYLHKPVTDSGQPILRLKLVDGRCRVQFPLALINLVVWNFWVFFPKLR